MSNDRIKYGPKSLTLIYHPTSESTPALQSPLCGKAHVNTHFASVSWIPGPSLLEASLSGAMEAPWQVPDEQKTHINQFMFQESIYKHPSNVAYQEVFFGLLGSRKRLRSVENLAVPGKSNVAMRRLVSLNYEDCELVKTFCGLGLGLG